MFKLIKALGCLSIIVFIAFTIIAVLFGGNKIKDLGDKTTGIIKKAFYKASEEADKIHKEVKKRIDKIERSLKNERKKDINN
ncbi:MAG: hypothetical protein ABDH16_00660 [Thermodesulfovibrionaceae bacterium]